MNRKSNRFYSTWQEASVAAIALGIQSSSGYASNHYLDLKLPSKPRQVYPDFPGFSKFIGHASRYHAPRQEGFYPTWQEAVKAAHSIGINTGVDWQKRFHEDPRLPSSPYNYYRGFPGFPLSRKSIPKLMAGSS